ncbi:hypothetical protein M9Y10_023678 [Tritrichomonas musculus]|uniref:G domain-containing protein n=1 Tax=Tritrichomonas musculus TaxID=1915356 RepID=A0ABR2KWQ4_9EUKA
MTKVYPSLRIILDIKTRMVDEKCQVKTSKQAIVFGNTGSGKTSLSCVMTGKNVKVVDDDGEIVLQYEGISSGNVSETEIPGIMVDELNDFTIVDTPGYDDTKGYLQEIKGAFSTHDVLCSSKKEANAKILIVVRAGEIGSKRSKGVQDLLARFDSMFPNLTESEKNAVGLVITCEEMGKPVNEYIKKLNRKDSTQITKKWCEYFINHPEQQFVFPAATEDMENKTFDFDDKNRLKEFIQKGQFIVPHPNLSLGKDSILYLENGFLSHTSDLLNEADKIVKCITDIYKQITKGEDLNKWSNKIKNISQMKISSPGILLDLIQNNFSDNKSKFVDSIEKLEDLDALHSFFVDVLKINDDKIDDEIKKPIDNKITKLISEFNTYKDSINKKELAERMEKAKEEAERQKQEEENRRKREVAEERRRRYEAEQESRRIREEEKRRRREEENRRRREEENRRRREEENRRRREEENRRRREEENQRSGWEEKRRKMIEIQKEINNKKEELDRLRRRNDYLENEIQRSRRWFIFGFAVEINLKNEYDRNSIEIFNLTKSIENLESVYLNLKCQSFLEPQCIIQ